ncbi:MAG: V8-like Glu-specific endopeptidase [Myxococcota bacterium]|jgi:V8-like Glu-specific endopeptidase
MTLLLLSAVALALPPLAGQGIDDLDWVDVDVDELRELAQVQLQPDGIWEGELVRGDHRNVVALAMVDPWYGQLSVFCSGSLIHPEWILTASHCLDAVDAYEAYGFEYYALTGENIIDGAYDDVAAFRRTFIHEEFSGEPYITNDIGLVRLDTGLNNVPVAVLNDKTVKDTWLGDEHNYVGFGSTYDNRGDSGVKRDTWIPIVEFDEMYLYAYSPDTNVCSGDSGGPSFRDTANGPVQVGVNVFVSPGCAGGSNGSTRVDSYLDWILDKVDDLELSSEQGTGTGGTTGGTEGTSSTGSGGLQRPSGQPESFGEEWKPAITPEKGTYGVGMRCSSTGGASGWLAILPVVGMLLRRRSR